MPHIDDALTDTDPGFAPWLQPAGRVDGGARPLPDPAPLTPAEWAATLPAPARGRRHVRPEGDGGAIRLEGWSEGDRSDVVEMERDAFAAAQAAGFDPFYLAAAPGRGLIVPSRL